MCDPLVLAIHLLVTVAKLLRPGGVRATLFVSPRRIPKLGALVKPATLLEFHQALVDRKGPSAELIAAIVEMKRRNPRLGCVRIARQICDAFGVDIDKDVVRRVLAKHYRPGDSGTDGPPG